MRLSGRYGADAPALIAQAAPGELQSIAGTAYVWAELRWAVRHEYVAHLDDLLLRRVRLGLLLPRGGAELFPYVRAICQQELGWDDARWQAEEERYVALWHKHYSLPGPATIPDWRALLAEAYTRRDVTVASRQRQAHQRRRAVLLTSVTVGLGCLLLRHHRRKEAAA